jgi:pilus assembly protein CpaB
VIRSLTSTRMGTVIIAGVTTLLAGAMLLIYLAQYRDSVNKGAEPVTVLVANRLIPKNTPGDVVGSQRYFIQRRMPQDQVKNGAITDPSTLKGDVAATDIYPGQQLLASEFETKPANALTYKLTGSQRAVSVSLDAAHGLIGDVQTGDHVDVLGGFNVVPVNGQGVPQNSGASRPVLRTLMQNVLVLSAPSGTSGGLGGQTTQQVVLRVTDDQAAQLAFAADNGKVWLVLRPQTGASPTPTSFVTLETLLLGLKPITVIHGFGGRP